MKRVGLTMKAHLIRGAFCVLVLLAVCVIPFALAQRTTANRHRPANVITVTNTNDSGHGSPPRMVCDEIHCDRRGCLLWMNYG